MPRAQFCKSSAFAYNNAFKELFSPLPSTAYFNLSRGYLSWNVCNSPGMNIFLQDPNAQKRRAKNVQNGRKSAQKRCKRAQIQKTLPLNRKQLLTHFCLYLSEHSDTICREKCETTARKNLWRADFSKTSTFSFTSVNLHFRAETQRHVNLRYFGGPRSDMCVSINGGTRK